MLDDLKAALPIVQTFIVPVIGYVGYVMRGIRNEFRVLNGRMTRIEEWRHNHSEAMERELDQIHEHLDERRR